MSRQATQLSIAVLLAFSGLASTSAAEPSHTTISVEKMCCNGCAQKIARQIYVVRGVKEVRVNIEKKLVFVFPQRNATVSPKSIWEAVEKGEDRPLRLAGPSGTFESKPPY